MNDLIYRLRQELQINADPETLASGKRFFKENETPKLIGLKSPVFGKIGRPVTLYATHAYEGFIDIIIITWPD